MFNKEGEVIKEKPVEVKGRPIESKDVPLDISDLNKVRVKDLDDGEETEDSEGNSERKIVKPRRKRMSVGDE